MKRHLHQFPQTERNLVPQQEVTRLLHDSLAEWIPKKNIINKWMDIASKKLGKEIQANDLLTVYKEGWIKEALDPFKQSEVWSYQNEIMRAMKTAENSVAIYLHANLTTLKEKGEKMTTAEPSTETATRAATEHWKEVSKIVLQKSRKETTTESPQTEEGPPTEAETQPSLLEHWKEISAKSAHHGWTPEKTAVPIEHIPAHPHAAEKVHKHKPKKIQKPTEEKSTERQEKPGEVTEEKVSTEINKPPVEHLHQHVVEKPPSSGETSKATPEHPGEGVKGKEDPKAKEENLNVPTESHGPQTQEDFPTSTSQPQQLDLRTMEATRFEQQPPDQQKTVEFHPSDESKQPSKQPDDLRTKEAILFENEPPLDLNRERLRPTDLTTAREQASSDVKDLLERQEMPSNLF